MNRFMATHDARSGNGAAPAVVLFCKYPEPGRVKTRLAASIGPDRATAVYRQMVRSTLDCVRGLQPEPEMFVFFTPPGSAQSTQAWLQVPARYIPQCEGDLGERMLDAFRRTTTPDRRPALIIGGDCPGLARRHLVQAFLCLDDHDLVLGPTEDGGYYAIGASAPHPTLFRDIPWSTDAVWGQTLERIAEAGLSVATLPRLRDIDTLADLEAYCREAPGSALALALQRTGERTGE